MNNLPSQPGQPGSRYDEIYSPVAKWFVEHGISPEWVASVPDSPGAPGTNAAVADEMRFLLAAAEGAAILNREFPDGPT